MRKAKFWLDTLNTSVEGYTDGSQWNGWAVPYFDRRQADRLVEIYNSLEWGPEKKAWYEAGNDQYCFIVDGSSEPECYSGETLSEENVHGSLYPVGARNWIWEAAGDS